MAIKKTSIAQGMIPKHIGGHGKGLRTRARETRLASRLRQGASTICDQVVRCQAALEFSRDLSRIISLVYFDTGQFSFRIAPQTTPRKWR